MYHRLWKPEPLARPDRSLQPLTSHSPMSTGDSTIVENDPVNYFSSHINIAKVGDSATYQRAVSTYVPTGYKKSWVVSTV